MTELLERAVREVHKLSPAEQDAIATLILAEIADEQAWAESFGRTQDRLA